MRSGFGIASACLFLTAVAATSALGSIPPTADSVREGARHAALVEAGGIASGLSRPSNAPQCPLTGNADGQIVPSSATLSHPAHGAPGNAVDDAERDMETVRDAAFESYAALIPAIAWPSAQASGLDIDNGAAVASANRAGGAAARQALESRVEVARGSIRRHAATDLPDPNGWAMVVAGLLGVCVIARRRAPL